MHRQLKQLALLLLLTSSLAASWKPWRLHAETPEPKGAAHAQDEAANPNAPGYIIGPGDTLDVRVFGAPQFSLTVQVRPDGAISMPLLNDIQSSGLTPMQLATTITTRLAKYIVDPAVTVIVTQTGGARVYILGEVRQPGPITILPNMTILQCIAAAGGLTEYAKQGGIYIIRRENGTAQHLNFHYKKALRGGDDVMVKARDVIVVP